MRTRPRWCKVHSTSVSDAIRRVAERRRDWDVVNSLLGLGSFIARVAPSWAI